MKENRSRRNGFQAFENDWVHYYTHHAVPKSRFGKFMRRFHLEHHFGIAHSQFGLSSSLWDLVFQIFWTTGAFKRRKPGSADPS